MKVVRLPVQEMTRERFAPFGVLIDSRGSVELDLGGAAAQMTGATSERRALAFQFMARHTRTMQLFSPMVGSRSIICVAPPAPERDAPAPGEVVAFLVDGRLPYAYHKGTWHTPPFPVGEWSSYLVVDRAGTLDDDYELVDMRAAHDCTFEIDL
jgi:ureidoglycolate hydrolase